MEISLLISAVVYGVSVSGILFLVSLAISIGFGLMRIVNMEAMLYYTFGAYMVYSIVNITGSFIAGAICSIIVSSLLGLIVETQLLRRV